MRWRMRRRIMQNKRRDATHNVLALTKTLSVFHQLKLLTITFKTYRKAGPDLDMWGRLGSLCVEALSTSSKYYSRSRKYYYELVANT